MAARRAIGRRVQDQRMRKDFTQEKLAERAGIDRSTVQRLEAGTSDAKISHLLRVARALDIHVTDFLD
ncbi:helix-turn-helix domain-containing protein [Streptomyces sp. NRRL F-5135]|uniref:helix-turn-helix domain-containing protein n=1 Tax=Streptomyces sp. NRRL F-5135 TaxID=1463858 RepID=UPI0004C8A55A|nr:helix-turn-helix transcriptional regulator [Streptomyces sp. NRRL F-5135]